MLNGFWFLEIQPRNLSLCTVEALIVTEGPGVFRWQQTEGQSFEMIWLRRSANTLQGVGTDTAVRNLPQPLSRLGSIFTEQPVQVGAHLLNLGTHPS